MNWPQLLSHGFPFPTWPLCLDVRAALRKLAVSWQPTLHTAGKDQPLSTNISPRGSRWGTAGHLELVSLLLANRWCTPVQVVPALVGNRSCDGLQELKNLVAAGNLWKCSVFKMSFEICAWISHFLSLHWGFALSRNNHGLYLIYASKQALCSHKEKSFFCSRARPGLVPSGDKHWHWPGLFCLVQGNICRAGAGFGAKWWRGRVVQNW